MKYYRFLSDIDIPPWKYQGGHFDFGPFVFLLFSGTGEIFWANIRYIIGTSIWDGLVVEPLLNVDLTQVIGKIESAKISG